MDSKKPPDLPPRPTGSPSRRLPPELPPRPGVSASPVRPDRHDWPSYAGNLVASSDEQSSTSSLNSLLLPKSPSAPAAPLSGNEAYIPIISREGSTSASAMQQPVEIPEIVHTAASSPELDSHPRFPPSRRSSNGITHSIASSNGSDPRRAEPHSSQSHRPFVNLYGRRSAEEHYHEALEELQALEVEEFLTRAGKYMDEVIFENSVRPMPKPVLEKYAKSGRWTDYFRFGEDWLCFQAESRLPRNLLATEKPGRFSFSQSRLGLERLYVLLPPSLLEKILAGNVVKLYRWHDPVYTAKWAGLYLALWYYDQIPAAFFTFLCYLVLRPKIFPPSPAEVQRRLVERRARSREAQELDEDLSKRQKMGEVSKSLAQSVGVAALIGGIGIGYSPHKDDGSRSITPEDGCSSDSEMEVPHPLAPKNRHRGKYGMYRLVKEMLDRFGPSTMMLINDGADYFEKAKNCVLWRRPAATQQSLIIIGCWTVFLSILSARLQLKLLLLWVWLQFFIVWPIQDRHPRYRRALNPWWWLLWNVPNDAECALGIVKSRAAMAAAAKNETGGATGITRARSVSSASHRSSDSLLKRRSSSSLSSLGSILPGQEILSRHFALFKGVPGHLQFTRTEMFFSPVRGLRTISSRFWKRSSNPDVLKMPKHMDYPADVDKRITSSFRYSLDQIVSVKKESRLDIGVFDTDGLRMTFSDGSIFRLASVSKRDEAFSFILAHSAGPRSI